ncbi:MAG TPA: RpiB/LacA/LacB family sugar-phosphate isomerase [Terriglobales bacterium]|nr:RpiB/LacA/LacB family sugar-phosphate isomerase [Terriglobales bacterium]
MLVGLGSDLDGFELKEHLKTLFNHRSYTLLDLCTCDRDPNRCHGIPDRLASEISAGYVDRGLLTCSSAISAAVAANKYARVRAAVCHEPDYARLAVQDDAMNLLVIDTRVATHALAFELADAFLKASPARQRRASGLHPRILARVVAHIRSHLDVPLVVSDLACLAEMSESHFSKLFRQDIGLTPHQFVLNERINRSKLLLRRDGSHIADIALEVGFRHQAHFTTAFRSVVGITPRQFQRCSCAGAHPTCSAGPAPGRPARRVISAST